MSTFSPDKLPRDLDQLAHREDAQAVLATVRAMLGAPVFVHNVPIAMLTKIVGDESLSMRMRLRAAELLARLQVKLVESLASLSGAREQALSELGIDGSGKSTDGGRPPKIVVNISNDVPVRTRPPKHLPSGNGDAKPESNGHDH